MRYRVGVQIQHVQSLTAIMQEGDPEGWWEETFKGHVDSKPRGPEGISFDLSFPGSQHVYGLPEHATSMALKPTVNLRAPPPPPCVGQCQDYSCLRLASSKASCLPRS